MSLDNTPVDYPMLFNEAPHSLEVGGAQSLFAYPTPHGSPQDYNASPYPAWLGSTGSIPTYNYHDSPSSFEGSELSASSALTPEATISMEASEDLQVAPTSIQVSTVFHPNHHGSETDMIVLSDDGVYFYTHAAFIRQVSEKASEHFLSYAVPDMEETVVQLPLSSAVLNIVLHTMYGTSCADHAPTCQQLSEAVDKLAVFGVTPRSLILPNTPLYNVLVAQAPCRPLDIYALAAQHDLPELAKYASSHLLTFPLSNIDDAMAARIGTHYLKGIFLLQMTRSAALKELVMCAPRDFHRPTKDCGRFDRQQQTLMKAWAAGAADLASEMAPDASAHHLQSVYGRQGSQIECPDCREAFERHLRKTIFSWSGVKTTI